MVVDENPIVDAVCVVIVCLLFLVLLIRWDKIREEFQEHEDALR